MGFFPGAGIHNIHMNQGNDAKFAGDDGPWQDGGLLFSFPQPIARCGGSPCSWPSSRRRCTPTISPDTRSPRPPPATGSCASSPRAAGARRGSPRRSPCSTRGRGGRPGRAGASPTIARPAVRSPARSPRARRSRSRSRAGRVGEHRGHHHAARRERPEDRRRRLQQAPGARPRGTPWSSGHDGDGEGGRLSGRTSPRSRGDGPRRPRRLAEQGHAARRTRHTVVVSLILCAAAPGCRSRPPTRAAVRSLPAVTTWRPSGRNDACSTGASWP
jgi:hypothetical protein